MIWRSLAFIGLLVWLEFGPPPEETEFWTSVYDLGHIALFAVLTWLALDLLAGVARDRSPRWRLFTFVAVMLVLAALSEWVQYFDPFREVSIADFFRDATGILTALAWRRSPTAHPPNRRRAWRAITAAMIAGFTVPFFLVVAAYLDRERTLPDLTRFGDQAWEEHFLHLQSAQLVSTERRDVQGQPLFAIRMEPGRYPGFLIEPWPKWSDYARLEFTVCSDSDTPVDLTIRIHDRDHDGEFSDRYNTLLHVSRAPQAVVIGLDEVAAAPASRTLNLGKVAGLSGFVKDLDRPLTVWISQLRLAGRRSQG